MPEQLKKLGGFMTKDAYASYSNSFKSYAQDISSIAVMTAEEELGHFQDLQQLVM